MNERCDLLVMLNKNHIQVKQNVIFSVVIGLKQDFWIYVKGKNDNIGDFYIYVCSTGNYIRMYLQNFFANQWL